MSKHSKQIKVGLLLFAVVGVAALAAQRNSRFRNCRISPHFPEDTRRAQPSQQDLLKAGEKLGEIGDLDNPQNQKDIGQSIAIGITNRHHLSKNKALNEYVTLVGLTVAAASPRPELDYAFGVLETTDVGAYSTPGGYIFITRGALELVQDEAELAGVLAHEVAHVVLNHGIEAVKNAKRKEIADPFVKQYGAKFGEYGQYATEGTDFIFVKGYSQGQEREADANAIKYLIAARYEPNGLMRFLMRLEAKAGPQAKNVQQQLMSTHPGTTERISNVQKLILASNAKGAVNKERFQKAMAVK